MLDASPAPAPAPAPASAFAATSGHGGPASPAPPRGIDTTRVLNLFGYVGPVASLMTHALFPTARAHSGSGLGLLGGGHGGGHGGAHIQRGVPSVGAAGSDGRLRMRPPTGLTPGRTRFVVTRTEDAIDSVLPCAAERVFKRPGRFANASGLRFSYGGEQHHKQRR